MHHDEDHWIQPFVGSLERVLENNQRGAVLAKLRRGFTNSPAERDIWVYGHLHGASAPHMEPAALIASLFALWYQGGRDVARVERSLGRSFSRLRTDAASDSVEKRFALLLDSHPDDLPSRLRQAVSLLKSKEIPVDWAQLLRDLLDWGDERRNVQRTWARDFWTGAVPDEGVARENETAAEPQQAKGE